MASGIFGVSLLGLYAAQSAIRTTEHNIANANTPGYHRQQVNFTTPAPTYTTTGFFGNGVNVSSVTRVFNQFLDNELLLSQGQLARYQAYAAYAGQIDITLGDQDSGLSSALSSFFGAVNEVANDPTSLAAREAMLSTGRNLAGRLNNLAKVLDDTRKTINQEIGSIASQVNSYARQIAVLNDKIASTEALNGQPANDLRDQREQLAAEINKLINVSVITQSDGSYNLYVGSGQPLVVGVTANPLSAVSDPVDPLQQVLAVSIGGTAIQLDTALVTGGRIGGLLALRDDILVPAQQDLGRIGVSLAQSFNAQHALGFDLNGAAGGDFFASAASLIRQPSAYTSNSGDEVLTATLVDSNLLTSSEYDLIYNGAGSYTLVRLSDGASTTGAIGAVTTIGGVAQGFTLAEDGNAASNAAAGDRWRLRLTSGAALSFSVAVSDPAAIAAASSATGVPGDNSNAVALAQLQTSAQLSNSTATYQAVYNQLIGRTANLASEADISQTAYETLSQQAFEAQQSFSGVNLDEEAANLIIFQQAYQAAARALDIASSLFDEILAVAR